MGFDYSLGVNVRVKIVATESGFDVYSNDNLLTSYATQHNLGPDSVKKATFYCEASAAYETVDAAVKGIEAIYS